MKLLNLKSPVLVIILMLGGAIHAMKPKSMEQQLPAGYGKYLTHIKIDGEKGMTPIDQIFIMPYTAGPHLDVQESQGTTLTGIQDFAVRQQRTGQWKPRESLIYALKTPILLNVTSHHPELFVSVKTHDGVKNVTALFKDDDFDKLSKANTLKINLSITNPQEQVVFESQK